MVRLYNARSGMTYTLHASLILAMGGSEIRDLGVRGTEKLEFLRKIIQSIRAA